MTTMTNHRPRSRIWSSVVKAMLPFLLFVTVRHLLGLGSPNALAEFFAWWMVAAMVDIGIVLPFALFPVGVVLARKLGRSRRLLRTAAMVGILISALSYVLVAWAYPVLATRWLEPERGLVAADTLGFEPRTPIGLARQLRFVEANPAEEYSWSVNDPHQWSPNYLRWRLHGPVAWMIYGLISLLLGVLTAELTVDLTRGRRRNACLAIGLVGAVAFLVCFLWVASGPALARDSTMLWGIAAAWGPLTVPLAEAMLIAHLVRSRRYG